MFSNYQHRDYIRDIAAERMQRQITQDRSRSRSRSRSRRSIARSRSVPATSLVSRSLRYDGSTRIVRTCEMHLGVTRAGGPQGGGFGLGASTYRGLVLTFSPTGMTAWGSNVNYTTSAIPNATEIASLWERVKIEKIELSLSTNVADPAGSGDAVADSGAINLLLANDCNGPTTGTTLDMIQQMSTCKRVQVGGDYPLVKWTVKPKYQRLIQWTSIASSYEPAIGYVQSDTDIPHYGVRVGIVSPTFSGCSFQITAKFYLSCKNLH